MPEFDWEAPRAGANGSMCSGSRPKLCACRQDLEGPEFAVNNVFPRIDDIKGMCYNVLGATAPDWMVEMLPQEAVGGGFTSRCILVCEHRKRKIVVDPRPTRAELETKRSLLKDLRQIRLLSGGVDRKCSRTILRGDSPGAIVLRGGNQNIK